MVVHGAFIADDAVAFLNRQPDDFVFADALRGKYEGLVEE